MHQCKENCHKLQKSSWEKIYLSCVLEIFFILPDIIEGEEFKTYSATSRCFGFIFGELPRCPSLSPVSRVKRKREKGTEKVDGEHTICIQCEVMVMVCLISKLFLWYLIFLCMEKGPLKVHWVPWEWKHVLTRLVAFVIFTLWQMSVDHEVNVVIFQSVDSGLKLVMVMALSEKKVKVRVKPQELNKFRLSY